MTGVSGSGKSSLFAHLFRQLEREDVVPLAHAAGINARLIATTIPGVPSQALHERPGVELRELPRLDADEARRIAGAVCGRYHRRLNPEILQVLLEKRLADGRLSAGVPLWLELALEELNLLDADDFARAERDYAARARSRRSPSRCAVGLPG